MRIAIITRDLSPVICGIGDHSVYLKNALQLQGHEVTLIAGEGNPDAGRRILKRFWHKDHLAVLDRELRQIKPDQVVLQYTPLMYAVNRRHQNSALERFWSDCTNRWNTSLFIHESYFIAWWHLPSMIKGRIERRIMKKMVENSRNVFTASEPLLKEIAEWPGDAQKTLLPIGSAFSVQPIDLVKQRREHGLDNSIMVLTLFGGGEALRHMKGHVNAVDAAFIRLGVPACWLLLGGISRDWFSLRLPVLMPGFMPPEHLSAWLQMTDIFLMPHIGGLSAKRSTLMAAMQHGLPVVGTAGPMTDGLWSGVNSVTLVAGSSPHDFADAVVGLQKNEALRKQHGLANRLYFDTHFTADRIARNFLDFIG